MDSSASGASTAPQYVTVDDRLPVDTIFYLKADLGDCLRIAAKGHGTCIVSATFHARMIEASSAEARREFEQRSRGLEARRNVQLRAIVRHRNTCTATGRRHALPGGARSRERSGSTSTRTRGSRRTSSRSAGGGDSGPSGEPAGEPPSRRRHALHLSLAGVVA